MAETGGVSGVGATPGVQPQQSVSVNDFKVAFSRAAGLRVEDAPQLTPEKAAAAFVAMRGKKDDARDPSKLALFNDLSTLSQYPSDPRNAQAVAFTQQMSAEVDRLLEAGQGASNLANAMSPPPEEAAPSPTAQPAATPKASMFDVLFAKQNPSLAPFLLANKQLSAFDMMYLMSPPPPGATPDRATRLTQIDPKPRAWAKAAAASSMKTTWANTSKPGGAWGTPGLPKSPPAATTASASSGAKTPATSATLPTAREVSKVLLAPAPAPAPATLPSVREVSKVLLAPAPAPAPAVKAAPPPPPAPKAAPPPPPKPAPAPAPSKRK